MKADILIKHIKNSQWGVVLANAKVVIYVVIYSKIKGMRLTNLQCL